MYLLSPSSRLLTVLCPIHTVCKCVYRTYVHTYVHIVNLINVYLCRQDCGHMYRHIYTHIYVCYVHIWNTYRVCICVSMFSSRNDFASCPQGTLGSAWGHFLACHTGTGCYHHPTAHWTVAFPKKKPSQPKCQQLTCCCSCCLVAKLCPILCVPMDCSTPSFPVLHYLPECAQIVDMYTLPYTKQITNKDLLYSTGNHSVLCGDLSGKEIQEGIYAHT